MTHLDMDPYDYQIEDMQFLVQFKKGALLHEPGVGKTFGALLAMTYVLEKEGGQALVIMPPILLDTWQEKLYTYFDTTLSSLIYRGTPLQRKKFNLVNHHIVFVSFDLFQRDYDIFKKIQWKYITIDETKYIKNGEVKKSAKTKRMNKFGCVQALTHKAEYVTLMNGTPVTKSPADLFHILHLMNPNIYVSKKNFLRHHAKYSKDEGGFPMIVGWKNLNMIEELLTIYSRRLIKKEVLELPEKQLLIKQFNLEPKHQKKLKELWDFGFLEMEDLSEEQKFLEGMSLMMQVRQAMIDPSIVDIKERSIYFDALEDLLESLGGEQVILFAHFHNTINLLKEFLDGKKVKYRELHGRVGQAKKTAAVEGFKNKEFQLLLANAKSAGVGLDFQQARNVIFFELDYEVDSFWQGQDRVHRPGQTEQVNIWVFVSRNTPSVDLFRSVKTNINYVSEILKGREDSSRLFDSRITIKEEEAWKNL
ncbi:MAG: DEAD/DEAH box helicase [Campylobacterota bacterium]|nr:DEAD/DEAH box helicase [Campylobacterota bacterium]